MKKVISLTLAAVMLVISGCSNTPEETVSPQDILSEYLANVENFAVPTREFGEPTSYVDMTDKMVTGILYPETEYEFLNTSIDNWSLETAEYYKNETADNKRKSDPAELTVDYESFCVAENLVSIKMKGVFISPQLAHPIDIFKTFNANTKDGKLLTAKDIFTADGLKAFEKKIATTAGVAEDEINEKITELFVLKKDGIEIILNRGDYLPMSDGTKTLFFPYTDIKEMLDDSFVLKPQPPKVEEPKLEQKPVAQAAPVSKSNTSGKKMIALTFDDGPSVHTERLLDIFAKHGGKGTFFVVGNLIDRRPDTAKRIVSEGHELANHGWDHRQLTSLDAQGVKDQIMMTKAKIYNTTGVDTAIMRPPYGSCNNAVKAVGKELGVSFIHWSIDTLDWKTKNAQSIYNEIIKNAKNGSIVLCHDLYKTTVDAMERVIPKLIEDGYELVTVSELMSGSLEPGKMYYRK